MTPHPSRLNWVLELGFLSLVRFSVIDQVATEIALPHDHREQVILSKLLYLLHSGGHLKEGARAESTAGVGWSYLFWLLIIHSSLVHSPGLYKNRFRTQELP